MKSYAAFHISLFHSRLDLRHSLRFVDIADICNIGSCCCLYSSLERALASHFWVYIG